jgi:hypothetical protein
LGFVFLGYFCTKVLSLEGSKGLRFSVFLLFSCFFVASNVFGQSARLKEYNSIGWYNLFGTFKLSENWGIHTDYQFRRNEWISSWQQSLLRVGVNYELHPQCQLRVGYGWIETFPYGTHNLNSMGKDFTEHRLFQAITLRNQIGAVDLSHRFMLEQRWVGRYSAATLDREDDYPLLHRMRYMFRFQRSLKGGEIKAKTPYLAVYDEVFIGFGKNVNENIFDQNRLGVVFGYQFNSQLSLEAGYLNQLVQLGREVDGRNVFQFNDGVQVNFVVKVN